MTQNKTSQRLRFRPVWKIAICLIILAGIFFALFSSTAVKHLWIPQFARMIGCTISVEEAAFYPFRKGPNLFVQKLSLKGPQGDTVELEFGEARIHPFFLCLGIVDLDLIRLSGAEIRTSGKFSSMDGPSPLVTGNLKIGSVDVIGSKMYFSGTPFEEIRISSAVLSGLLAESENHFTGSFTIYPDGEKTEESPRCSMQVDSSFLLDSKFRPQKISGSISTGGGSGIWNKRPLTALGGSVFFSAEGRHAGEPLNLNVHADFSSVDCMDIVQMKGKGLWNLETGKGSLDLETSIRFSDIRTHELYFPDTIGIRIFPEHLHMDAWQLSLQWDNRTFSWVSNGEIKADKIWIQDTKSVTGGELRFHHDMSYSIATEELSVKNLDDKLTIGTSSSECKNEGIFIFSHDANGYHVKANNSSLIFRLHSLPAELLNSFFPFDFADGTFSLDYKITADSEAQKLNGNMGVLIRGAAFDNAEGKRTIKPFDIFTNFSFHSKGLENVTGLIVDTCSVDMYAEEQKHILQAEMSGSWNPGGSGLTLSGNMDLTPYEAAGRLCDPLAEDFRALLRRHKAEKTGYHCSVTMDWDLHRTKQLSFDFRTSFDTLAFLEAGIKTPLNLDVSGRMLKDKAAPCSSILFDSIRLKASDLVDASADGRLSPSSGQSDFRIAVSRFSPAVLRGILRLFTHDYFTEEQISLLRWQALSGTAAFSFDSENRILKVTPFRVDMIPDPKKSSVSLTLDHDFICFLDDPLKTEAALTMTMENLPLKWFDFLLPADASYKFLSGVVNGSAEVTVRNNGTDIFLDHDFMVEGYSFSVGDSIWHIGDCRVGGKSLFRNAFTSYDLIQTSFRCLEDTREYMNLVVDGSLAFTPEGKTFYDFVLHDTSELFPEKLFGDAANLFRINHCDITGKFRYDGNEDYSRNAFTMNWDVRALDLGFRSSQYEPRPLHGSVQLDLISHPDALHVKTAGITLEDAKQKTVFDLQTGGVYADIKKSEGHTSASCFIRSRGIDGEFLIRAMAAGAGPGNVSSDLQNERQDERQDELSSHVWPILHEPVPFSLHGLQTSLTADLQNITLTDHLQMSLAGKLQVRDNTLQTSDILLNVNDTPAHCSVKIITDVPDGYEYEGELSAEQLDLSRLFLAIAELKEHDTVIKNIRGTIQKLDFSVRGKGLSLENLDKSLNLKLAVSAENLSVPFDAGATVVLLRILLLPVQQIPRLVKIIPQSVLRDFLQKLVGESMDIYSGYRNVDFSKGTLELESQGTDLHIKKMYFFGPQIRTRVQRGWFNPFYNELDIEFLTVFSGVALPFHFTGSLDDPQIEKSYFIGNFLKQTTLTAGEHTIRLLSLGQAIPDNESLWTEPSEIKPVPESRKRIRQESLQREEE